MEKKSELKYVSEEEGAGSQTGKLKKKLKQCQKEKEEYLFQAQRAKADLINYRRRQEQVLEEFRKFGQGGFVAELLPLIDSLSAAGDNKHLQPIKSQLEQILRKRGLTEIKAKGEKFNPHFHEAVEMAEGDESGIILEEIQKGYLLADRVLRPAKVKVAK